MRLTRLLSVRLLMLLLPLMVIIFGIFAYININTQKAQLMAVTKQNADEISDVIKRSTRYSMLLNRREDVHQIIKTIGSEKNVDGIRIYNKPGTIVFSTVPEEVGTTMDMNAKSCRICHHPNEQQPVKSLTLDERIRIFTSPKGYRVMNLVNPIRNELDCYNADCHAHSSTQTFLGMLEVKTSLQTVDRYIANNGRTMIGSAILKTLVIIIISVGFIWLVVRIPVKKLIAGTLEISKGNLDYSIDIQSQDEIGLLARSFNQMTQKLKEAYDEIKQWSKTLEKRVQEKTEEINRTQAHLIQVEKMASLGKLSATVAHELNNPLAGILTYIKLAIRRLKKDNLSTEEIEEMLQELDFVAKETMRCGNIVKNLLLFSRQQGGEFSIQDVNSIIERCIMLIGHQMEIQSVKLEKELIKENNTLLCDPDLLQQALLALLVNAIEAMPEGGTLRIATQYIQEIDGLQIVIGDTGVGIAEEDIPHLFEPFFTTKAEGKGIGLGLSVAYGVVEQHGGQIDVQSKINVGTTFTLHFPRNLSAEAE